MTTQISGSLCLDALRDYGSETATADDDKALAQLNNKIMEALPGVDSSTVGDAIDKAVAANPNMSMDEVFTQVVKSLNADCEDALINEIRSAWQSFAGVDNLTQDDIAGILPPKGALDPSQVDTQMSIKEAIAFFMLAMIELAGEESASQLFQNTQLRDQIMDLAKEKASDLKTKAVVNLICGLVASGAQIAGGVMAMKNSTNQAISGAWTGFGQAGGGMSNSIGGCITGFIDADIAINEGKSQMLSTMKDANSQLRQKAIEVIQTCIQMLQSLAQADYQTMTAIGRA